MATKKRSGSGRGKRSGTSKDTTERTLAAPETAPAFAETPAAPLPAPSGGGSPIKWIIGVIVVIAIAQVFIWQKGRGGRWDDKELKGLAEMGGTDPERGGLINPVGVTVGNDGSVYVADAGRPEEAATVRIVKFGKDGQVVKGFALTGKDVPPLNSLVGLTTDAKGEHVALDANPHGPKFLRFGDDGAVRIVQPVGMYGPYSITADPDGSLWVGSLWGASRHDETADVKTWLGKLGKAGSGSGKGELSGPSCAIRGSDGAMYVADRGNWRLQKFKANGQFDLAWNVPREKFGGVLRMLAMDGNGKLYVTAENGGAIWVFDRSLNPIARCAKVGQAGLQNPLGLCLDKEGSLYVADAGLKKILKFAAL